METNYSATFEFLSGQSAAIVELTDGHGNWAGGSRVDIRSTNKADLYEACYLRASQAAAVKGGILDRFSEVSQ